MTHPKLIEVLIQQTPRAMAALLIVSVAYCWMFINFIPHTLLILWLLLQVILVICRFYNIKMFKQYLIEQAQERIQKQKTLFIILNLFQAFMWTTSSVLVLMYAPQPFELVSLVIIIGIITAAVLSMSTFYTAYLVFFFAMLIPQIIILLYYGEPQHYSLAALTFVYILAIIQLSKSVYNGHLLNIKTNAKLEKSVEELHKLSMIDMMTNIYNRRYFFKVSQDLISIALREKSKLSLLMIDIDYFKNINDTYGHDAGDYILINVVKEIKKVTRKSDIFARMGGEEFSILLGNTSITGAAVIAEKMRSVIENTAFNYNNTVIKLTISIGISELNDQHNSIEELYKQADKQLYLAKNNGRNRVVPSV